MGVFPSESLDTQCLVFASQYPEHHERSQEWSENTGARGGGSLHRHADEEDTVLSGIWDTGPGSSLLKMHPAVTGETPGRRAALADAAPRWLTRPCPLRRKSGLRRRMQRGGRLPPRARQ